jgi:hypothetical protein
MVYWMHYCRTPSRKGRARLAVLLRAHEPFANSTAHERAGRLCMAMEIERRSTRAT